MATRTIGLELHDNDDDDAIDSKLNFCKQANGLFQSNNIYETLLDDFKLKSIQSKTTFHTTHLKTTPMTRSSLTNIKSNNFDGIGNKFCNLDLPNNQSPLNLPNYWFAYSMNQQPDEFRSGIRDQIWSDSNFGLIFNNKNNSGKKNVKALYNKQQGGLNMYRQKSPLNQSINGTHLKQARRKQSGIYYFFNK